MGQGALAEGKPMTTRSKRLRLNVPNSKIFEYKIPLSYLVKALA
jgi:hypothetical protein